MTTDQHLNTGAMALGALPDDERAAFVGHLDTCEVCADELAGFLQTAAVLGSSVAQTPPASLRRSVMEAIARTPQLPPLTEAGVDPTLGRHRQEVETPTAAPPLNPDVNVVQTVFDQPSATVIPFRRAWYRRPQALLAAAVAILVIGGGTGVVLANRSPVQSASACVAASTDKTVLVPTVGSGGDVTLAPSCDAATVHVPTLPAPPAGKVYQLWVMKGTNASAATSVGVMQKNADGSYSGVTASVHAGDSAVGVSLEPAPGSSEPTSDPFWVVPLSS